MDNETRIETISDWQRAVMDYAISHGWNQGFHPDVADAVLAKLMLVTTELAEAAEDVRTNRMTTVFTGENRKPEGFSTELADVVIRVLHLAALMGVDLEKEMRTKHAFNLTRPARHGGLRA